MKVEKRDGRIVEFDEKKIENAILSAFRSTGVDATPVRGLTQEVVRLIYERKQDVIHIEAIQDIVEDTLMLRGFMNVAKRYIKYREKHREARQLLEQVGVIDDLKFGPNAATVLKRYLLKDEDGNALETPSQMFRRVANAVANIEGMYGEGTEVKEYADLFYNMMANLEFLPNSPTLFNAGTPLGQCSACFVLPINDDMDSIFTSLKQMAMIQKSGGGTGFSFSRLRPAGATVGTTGGVASGPVSFMRIYDTATDVIKQGGKRRGANMSILRCDHPDIMEFIACKSDKRSFRNFNISIAITDKFMEALSNDDDIGLIAPQSGEMVKTISAGAIFDAIVHNAWNSGDPGLIFIDRINQEHPLEGMEIESTNPCVSSDTIVSTSDGLINILEVPNAIHTTRKLLYSLRTKEGYEVKLTQDHRVLTQEGWKEARQLENGDRILLQDGKGGFGDTGNLYIGQILGWFVGDGWTTGNDNRATLAFYHKDKGPLVKYYQRIVNERLDSNLSIISSRNRDEVRSKRLLDLVKEWGVELKDISLQILRSSEECQKGFLQGLFSADGSVQGTQKKGYTIRLSQSDLGILKTVQMMLLNFGIASKVYENRRKEQKQLFPDGKGDLKLYTTKANHELIISKDNILRFRDNIGFLLEYKQKELVQSILTLEKRGPYRESFTARFEALTPLDEEDVYDIVGTPKGGFIANGLIVHNCGEQPLLPYESCVLGSVNLAKMVERGEIDWDRLEEVVQLSVRFLDNIIDLNVYPVEDIEKMTKANRKIGLGIMGWADLLIALGIPYDSEIALNKAREVMSFIRQKAERASAELARIRGNFENFAYLKNRNTWKRNATLITIAPTGSISLIAQTTSGIEPIFAITHSRILTEGVTLTEVNELFKRTAEERGVWTENIEREIARTGSAQHLAEIPDDMKDVFKTAHEIDPEWHVRMQAAFQEHVDNAVSKTVNLPRSATANDVEKIYRLAYELKLKGITVFRDGCLETQVLYMGGCPTCEM